MSSRSLADQLSVISGRPRPIARRKRQQHLFDYVLKNTRDIGKDGVDHINTTNKVATRLGSLLSSQARSFFKHHLCGQFMSLESFMWYVRTENDQFRALPGHKAAVAGKKMSFAEKSKVSKSDLVLICADAYWQLVCQNDEIVNLMKDSTLPFDMYIVNTEGFRERVANAPWIVQTLELIRRALKEGAVYPSFDELFEKGSGFGKADIEKYAIEHGIEDHATAVKEVFESAIKEHYSSLIDQDVLAAREARAAQIAKAKAKVQQEAEEKKAHQEPAQEPSTDPVQEPAQDPVHAPDAVPAQEPATSDAEQGQDGVYTPGEGVI